MNDNPNLLAGCVVLHNPGVSIIRNIESYINALAVLYVVDNSEVINETLVDQMYAVGGKVNYIAQQSNTGIAAAMNIGAGLALNDGYSWLLTMDQDSSFGEGVFFDLWQSEIIPLKNIGIAAASYTDTYDRWQRPYNTHFNEIHFAISSGNIINLKAWKQVNGFEEKLFIDEVDHDYCLKLRQEHYKILISKGIFMDHAIGHQHKKTINGAETDEEINLHSPIRHYYMARNVLYLCKKYMFADFRFVLGRFYYLLKSFTKIILRYPRKRIYLKYFFAGIKDFAASNYYKYKK